MSELKDALATSRDAIKRALPEAERELAECRAHCAELEESIRLARLIVSSNPSGEGPALAPTTMHQAMTLILRDHPDGLPAPEIAREIERRDLYRRRDGKPAGLGQVHARVHNYPKLFVRDSGRIRLRNDSDV
jgi:hypothetical protein